MRSFRFLLVAVLLVLWGAPEGAEAQEPVRWRVKVSVTGPADVEAQIAEYLSRQLLTVRDLVLVPEGEADYELQVVAMRTRTMSGLENGFVLSIAVIKPFSSFADGLAEALSLSPEQGAMLRDVTADVRDVRDLWLRTGSGEDLGQVLQQVVVDFEAEHVEGMRRLLLQASAGSGASS